MSEADIQTAVNLAFILGAAVFFAAIIVLNEYWTRQNQKRRRDFRNAPQFRIERNDYADGKSLWFITEKDRSIGRDIIYRPSMSFSLSRFETLEDAREALAAATIVNSEIEIA